MFPVIGYVLELRGSTSDDVRMLVSENTSITINDLYENSIYTYNILVMNSIGTFSSNKRTICKDNY